MSIYSYSYSKNSDGLLKRDSKYSNRRTHDSSDLYSSYDDDLYVSKDNKYDDEIYARDDGYGHSGHKGGYGTSHGGGYGTSHGGYKKLDIYSTLAFLAFGLALAYLIYFCLPDPTRCQPMRRKRSVSFPNEREESVLDLLVKAQHLWG